jgi:hypothetical protein
MPRASREVRVPVFAPTRRCGSARPGRRLSSPRRDYAPVGSVRRHGPGRSIDTTDRSGRTITVALSRVRGEADAKGRTITIRRRAIMLPVCHICRVSVTSAVAEPLRSRCVSLPTSQGRQLTPVFYRPYDWVRWAAPPLKDHRPALSPSPPRTDRPRWVTSAASLPSCPPF